MGRPVIQRLSHGKALCRAVFARFVETFNWLVDVADGLKGDKDANPAGGGRITVDRSDPSAPVIRCSGCQGSGGGGESQEPDGPATPDADEPGSDPHEPYTDPEDNGDDPEAINGDGNEISDDVGFVGDGYDYCNSISGLGGGSPPPAGNGISSTCSV